MTTLAQEVERFNRAVKAAAIKIPPESVVPFHKKIHLDALRRIVFKTPVDTGRARGNWQGSVGSPAVGEVDTLDRNGAATVARGPADVRSLGAFEVSYISNNVPYIVPLENGSSRQFPHGMVRTTVIEIREGLGS